MQYQLEHHLFPTLPRYKYPELVCRRGCGLGLSCLQVPIVRKFAAEHALQYKADGLVTMYADHFANLKKNALAAAAE